MCVCLCVCIHIQLVHQMLASQLTLTYLPYIFKIINRIRLWLHSRHCFHLVSIIWKMLYPAMNEAKRVKLCFPDPPTPTSSALPLTVRIIREICRQGNLK